MKVSVIIPVYNRADFIGNCIRSVLEQNYKDFEFIIIENGSTDRTREVIAEFNDSRIKVYHSKQRLSCGIGRNKGYELSQGDILAFTDSDCIVDQDWLNELIKPFDKDSDIMIVGGQSIDPPARNYWEYVSNRCNHISDVSGYVNHVIGCNMALRRSFMDGHLFDPAFKKAGEDLDMCLFCGDEGKKVYYSHSAKVIHYHRSDFISFSNQMYRFGYSIAQVRVKHGLPIHRQIYRGGYLLFFLLFSILLIVSWQTKTNVGIMSLAAIFIFLAVLWRLRQLHPNKFPDLLKKVPGYLVRHVTFTLGELHYLFQKMVTDLRMRLKLN